MKQLFDNDHTILEALRSKSPTRINAALQHLCQSDKLKGGVRQQVYALRGDENDAREMLNHALVAFLNHVEDDKYDPTRSAISTYIVNIAAQMYYTRRRSEQRRVAMHDRSVDAGSTDIATNPEQEFDLQHQREILDKLLAMTGEKCRQLLQLHGHSYPMAEIAPTTPIAKQDTPSTAPTVPEEPIAQKIAPSDRSSYRSEARCQPRLRRHCRQQLYRGRFQSNLDGVRSGRI